ncbi:sensor domain-containing diguanylate cyclase [Leeia oryzae]|uniref:sensor domain-containing diguanylate cyclase n=1 Tax=Leeia oryzae TaxID=356662 RepID=UPI00036A9B6C|nr:diguanylate cyclase [Leeia oryzae]
MPKDDELLQALQEALLGLRTVLNNVGAYVYTKDKQGRYTFANELVCQLFGVPLEEIVGQDDSKFFDLEISRELQINDRRVLDFGEVIEKEELNIIKPSGETRVYWTVKAPIRDASGEVIGMGGISTDITERKRLESELLVKQQLLDTILNNVEAYVYMKNKDRRFLYVNHQTARVLGLPAEEIIGRRDEEVMAKDIADKLWALDKMVFDSGIKQSGEESFADPNGVLRHYWTIKTPIYLPDQPDSLIGFSTDITELHELKEVLESQAHYDSLTGVSNRRRFFMLAESEFSRAQRYAQPLSVMMIDIDYFKRVNDTYGHKTGDLLLKAVATHCMQNIRESDTLGRLGGEEFAILMPNTRLEEAVKLAHRLCKSFHKISVVTDQAAELKPTASIGVTALATQDTNFDSVLERADQAMYLAKANGRNQVCQLTDGLHG